MLLNDFEMATDGNGDLPVPDLRTMEELCGTFMKRRLEECYDLIKNMTAYHNDWDTSVQRSESSSSITFSFDSEIVALKAKMAEINKNLMKLPLAKPRTYMLREPIIKVVILTNLKGNNQGRNQFFQGASHGQNPPPAYQAPAYQAPGYQALVPQAPIPQPQVVTATEFTNYIKANDAILKNMHTNMTSLTNSNIELKNMFGQFMKMNTDSSSGSGTLPSDTITNPKEDLKVITTRSGNAYKGPTILTTSSLPKVVERETEVTRTRYLLLITEAPKTSNLWLSKLKLQYQILSPLLSPLLTNKDKLFEIARTPLNEHCSAVLLKKLPEKLGDPSKFLIPCDFSGMDEYLALSDLGTSINLILLSVWNKLSLPELSPTCMTLELADRSISRSVGVVEDVFDADPRVPLILGRSFLKTGHALIDVYEGELTLRVGKEAVTFNLDQTSRYSVNYDAMSVNRIYLIDVACEEYSQEVLGFSVSGNPTSSMEPIVSNSSPTLTPFGDKLKVVEPTNEKSSIDEPPVVELKDLTPHLEYAFLEGDDKLPVIIAKDLKDEEKTALIEVLNLHKQALAWQLSDIKGIDPEFYTHKILIEDDFKPAVQHQRRVNPKIHEVIKKEVLKLLDTGLIYPISDSPWVSPVQCVPIKGGFTIVENKENELIPTRLVTGWRVCIDYHNLNDVTHKDHFPLPFMDQMLERLVGNEYYYFLDGFLGYFQISIDTQDQEKTTFMCPYKTFAYRRMPFGLSNAPGMFQRHMMAIFHDMIEKTMEVFMDDFSVFRNSFKTCLTHLDKMLKQCKDTNLCLNWEKSHFMVKEGIVLGHKISKNGVEVDKAKVDVISKLPHPTTVKEAENLATDCLSRLENPHQGVLDNKEINETFPLETLNVVSSCGNSSTPCFKTPVECTPYKLMYGKACHLPIELEHKAYWALKHCNYDLLTAGAHRKVQLNELNELCDHAYKNSLIYKEKTKRLHDSKIKDRVFNVGDQVLLFNSRLKIFLGKLKTRWSEAFTITQVFPYGTVELSQTDGPNFKVNGHRLKHYFGEDITKMVVLDLQTFPKDQ
nr:DNA-directed DNA polymerase [Tanacetum cinerariifolium]